MSTSIHCPGCNQRYLIEPHHFGKSLKCRQCSLGFTASKPVPAPVQPPVQTADSLGVEIDTSIRHGSSSRTEVTSANGAMTNKKAFTYGALGCLGALAAMVAAAMLLLMFLFVIGDPPEPLTEAEQAMYDHHRRLEVAYDEANAPQQFRKFPEIEYYEALIKEEKELYGETRNSTLLEQLEHQGRRQQ